MKKLSDKSNLWKFTNKSCQQTADARLDVRAKHLFGLLGGGGGGGGGKEGGIKVIIVIVLLNKTLDPYLSSDWTWTKLKSIIWFWNLSF